MFKASVLSSFPNTIFVDISHSIESFNHIQAAFIVKSVFRDFPDGSIHILAVNSELSKGESFAIAKYKGQFFIANNNGCLGLIFDEVPEQVIQVDVPEYFPGSTFPELSVFSQLAVLIISGDDIESVGTRIQDIVRKPSMLPQIETNTINAGIIYIDSYGNAITNISKEFFNTYVADSKFEISIENNVSKIRKISNSYKDVETGSLLGLFNYIGLLELAVREGKADKLFNLNTETQIRIKFNL